MAAATLGAVCLISCCLLARWPNLKALPETLAPAADVAKGKAATQRVFTIIDRQPKIDASSEASWGCMLPC